ncbi:MAG TPA: saccharopine dehydrogenase C-terminal domain-containing protein [Amycolatopsis sp.]|uniref:saccharopine dehydrogenase C-terminal domain-containing protein n=1 Tax=Amycolatopsis sp. TaxID=37632 RepID=UPI002B495ED2|nr:saccharopine dehydrogenase C-terminal domain-containing protein [Amycolatopsis sp.]HKS47078.1 saccharopine dehydrogenase C-terminal domain-containing protein [Amycolatopsis sp.]
MPRVHWVGTGLSTGSGLRLLAEQADVALYGRTTAKAEACARRLGLAGKVTVAEIPALDPAPGDVVVSMLPATEHARLLRLSIAAGAHFADTSYAGPEIIALAKDVDVVVLTEAGLDPGIDHLLADDLMARGRAAVSGPATARFTSYCGGIPAVPNEFRYRFSWAPRGVLTALLTPARYIEDGVELAVDHPWEAARPHRVGAEEFEVYPNRDSIPFLARYAVPELWSLETFVRGTLRSHGWRAAWEPVFAELSTGDPDRITALAEDLARRYPATAADRDRVLLAVTLAVDGADGTAWSGEYVIDVTGDEEDSAMARLVSTPLAVGVAEILAGRLPAGLHRAAEGVRAARRWLGSLREHGIIADLTQSSTGDGSGK